MAADEASGRVLWERRAHQYELQRDSLHGLARERAERLNASVRLVAQLRLEADTLRAALAGGPVTEDSAGVRYAHLEADTLGHHVDVDAEVPPPPAEAAGSILLTRDPYAVWLSLLETPEGERLLLAETDARVTAALDSISTQAPEPPGLFDLPNPFSLRFWRDVLLFGGGIFIGSKL